MSANLIEQPKLTLYRGFPPSNSYTWSPFVTKLEFRLRHARIPYNLEMGNTREGPQGKIPYIDIGPLNNDNETRDLIGDSSVIINTLISKGAAQDLNTKLIPQQKAMDMGIRALCEEKLYFLGMGERWLENYYIHRDHILQSKPWIARVVIGNLIHKKILETVHLHGCGRSTKEEQKATREDIWQTLEDMTVGNRKEAGQDQARKSFWLLGGQEPSEADFVLYAFINSVLVCESCPESKRFVRGCVGLMDYANRIHDEYFPDYVKWEM